MNQVAMKEKISKEISEGTFGGDRPYEAYEYLLGISQDELQDKTILDLGSGNSEEFEQGIKKMGIRARVFSLNPLLGSNTSEGKRQRALSRKNKVVAGVAQRLPFRSGSFDEIISLHAIPLWSEAADYENIFSELDRVLKPGGTIKLFPISPYRKELLYETAIIHLRRRSYEVLWEWVEPDEARAKLFKTFRPDFRLTVKKPDGSI
ncbi:MAG: class I SAM-dependent methyltransferase [Candidatus Sungbacteria bacterium]|nr:class I SAM-dependent methyltransferase [Candidatus Sungbacteria bacterium]